MIKRLAICIVFFSCGHDRASTGMTGDASTSGNIDARTMPTADGGSIADGGPSPSMPDAAPDYGFTSVSCGATVCGQIETCCVDSHGNATCAAAGTCPSGSRSLCSGQEDCVLYNVCCGSNEGNTTTKECRPDNQCTSSGLGYACHSDADCVAYDNNFTKCCSSPLSIHKQCRPTCH